ncbi:hypothetical protein AX16_003764 [Volvariella volvacea WC 439]|nr:hypothetical protein AX16_003764 [Volvariella volvacea WC 439]
MISSIQTMRSIIFGLFWSVILASISSVTSIGTQCTAPLGPGTAAPNDPYWLETIRHEGRSPFHPNAGGYRVFRNVKDYGARGDGVTDDTDAINRAITDGGRCGGYNPRCESSTVSPAVVYFPRGTYLVSRPIVPYWYSQLIGDAKNPPTLLAANNFDGMAVIDANPYIPNGGGDQYWVNQNNFFRSIRNFVIDVRRVAPERSQGTGIHWQVSQATSLMNIRFEMSTAPNTAHQGIWMENGSGGFMGDLTFNGGKFGMWVGNQQFTVRNVTINNAQTAVYSIWNWGWTFQGININNCQVGFDLLTGGTTIENQSVGAEAIIDAVVSNTPIFVRSSQPSNGRLAGSLVLNNVRLNNVPVAVGVVGGAVVLQGGTTTIQNWVQGNVYTGTNPTGRFTQGNVAQFNKPSVLLDSAGRIFGRGHPQYENYAVSQFVSVRDEGAVGDGRTDDTAAIRRVFEKWAGCKIIYFPHGHYIVTGTITIPADTIVVGEAWSVIAGRGSAFQDYNNPQTIIRAGAPNSQGVLEITDMIFTTVGPAAGAVVLEWNVRHPNGQPGTTGMWDSHLRIGGAAGSNLENTQCPRSGAGGFTNCFAAFLALHLKRGSTAYLEATWVWLADHDLDGDGKSQISIYSGRGILSESEGPVWLIGTAEHHVLYQHNLVGARNHFMGLIQTESPYFQPNPATPAPFIVNTAWKDPTFSNGATRSAWALRVINSTDIIVFGAGFYSFFDAYTQDCIPPATCQSQLVTIDSSSSVSIYSLSTVATTYQISINEVGVVNQASNLNGFASTVTRWTRT